MKLKPILLRSAAAVLLGVAVPYSGAITTSAPVHAAVDIGITIDFGTFYDGLAPYGDWVSYGGRTVWIPADLPPQWRPYGLGHWVYTRRHGWLWVSDEPFGWATYHYGRWGFGDDVGWYWLPGYRWAPAWVSWRRSDDYVAWAPVPLDYPDDGVNVSINIGTMPDYYWQVVPAPAFLSVNVFSVVVRDRHRADRILRGTRIEGGVNFVNNTYVNTAIGIEFVEKKTKRKVKVFTVEGTARRDKSGKLKGNAIEVYAPEVKKDGVKKPKEVKSLDEVKAKRKKALSDETAIDGSKETGGKKGKKKDKVEKQSVPTDLQTDKKAGKKKKTKEPALELQTDQKAGKKKKKEQTILDQGGEQAGKKKKKQTTGDEQVVPDSQAKKKKKQSGG